MFNNHNEYNNYNNYNSYIDPENPIAKELREQALQSQDISIQIKRKLETGEELVTTYQNLPARWFRSGGVSIKAECRLYPFKTLFQVNLTGMKMTRGGNGKYTLKHPSFEIEVKIVFHY